jgi:hypothetical protein
MQDQSARISQVGRLLGPNSPDIIGSDSGDSEESVIDFRADIRARDHAPGGPIPMESGGGIFISNPPPAAQISLAEIAVNSREITQWHWAGWVCHDTPDRSVPVQNENR